jgi:dolichyl-phosphate-mannose--protein O-mannosyl transferase
VGGWADIRSRLVAPLPSDRLAGWLGPLAITLVAGFLRFWQLGNPTKLVFDEVYYAKNGHQLIQHGVEYDATKHSPEFVVHPPMGKWVIGFGEWLFGYNSVGWRFSVAVLGTLAVLIAARVARRMFRSTLLGCVAGLLLAMDGLAFVHSRTALLDPILMFFVLAAFACLLIDRDHARARLAFTIEGRRGSRTTLRRAFGPALGWRPWRIAAGVLLGLACGTKWSGLYFVAGFGLLTVCWDLGARRTAGIARPVTAMLARDALPAFLSIVGVALVVYLTTWTGWFLSDAAHAWDRGWAVTHPGPWWAPDALRSLWHYHAEAWNFHKNLHAFHPYKSNPWSWLALGRPVSYFYEGPTLGQQGCDVTQCSKAVTALGTPAIWWASVVAIFVLLFAWLGRRDWRAGAILMGIAAGYLPWFFWQERTIYSFYAVAFVPFLVLAVTMCVGMVIGPADASPRRRTWGAAIAGGYLLLVVLNFAWLYPVLSAHVMPYADWAHRMWFRSWI